MVWDILGVAAFVLASTTVWMVASTIRQLGKREPSAVSPLLRRALLIREIPAETLAAFAKERPGSERIAFLAPPIDADKQKRTHERDDTLHWRVDFDFAQLYVSPVTGPNDTPATPDQRTFGRIHQLVTLPSLHRD